MYNGKHTEARTPEAFVEFLRGLSVDAERLVSDHGADEVNSTTARFLKAAASYIEDLSRHALLKDTSGDQWQAMVGILSLALVYPIEDQGAEHDSV